MSVFVSYQVASGTSSPECAIWFTNSRGVPSWVRYEVEIISYAQRLSKVDQFVKEWQRSLFITSIENGDGNLPGVGVATDNPALKENQLAHPLILKSSQCNKVQVNIVHHRHVVRSEWGQQESCHKNRPTKSSARTTKIAWMGAHKIKQRKRKLVCLAEEFEGHKQNQKTHAGKGSAINLNDTYMNYDVPESINRG